MRSSILHRTPIMGIVFLLTASCISFGRPTAQDDQASAVSSVVPRFGEFESKADPIPNLPPVASRGGCEPRYRKAGATGTCINDKPCRGFGVLENGRAVCMCYAKRGGCDQGYRCDARGAQCVKEDETDLFNRTP